MAMKSTSNSNQCTGIRWPKVTIKSEHSNWKIDFFFENRSRGFSKSKFQF